MRKRSGRYSNARLALGAARWSALLFVDRPTEADWRLLPTLLRFDSI